MRWVLVLATAATAIAACGGDDDDDAAVTTSGPPTVATTVATTEPPSTTARPTTAVATAPATTEPAPPTTTEEDLKAVIAADVVTATQVNYDRLTDPSVEDLAAHLTAVVVPGSPAEQSLSAYVTELVSMGDGIIPGDPDVLKVYVQHIELIGESPHTAALVTLCEVENRPQATLARNSPSGEPIEVAGTDELHALQQIYDVRLAPAGWRIYDTKTDSGFDLIGADECPAV